MIPSMRVHRSTPLAALLAVLVAPALHTGRAQSSSPTSAPLAVADSFFSAIVQERWREAAQLVDLLTFGALRDQEVRNMRRARERAHPMSADELMKHDPKMPRVVAEYQAAQVNERSTEFDFLSYEYANVPTIDSLAALPVVDATARWLEAGDPRYRMRQAMAVQRSRCALPDSVLARFMPLVAYHVIGAVTADSLAYVLYEEHMSTPAIDSIDSASTRRRHQRNASRASFVEPPSVMTLRRLGGDWRIAPSFPFGNTAVMVAECPDAKPTRSRSP